VKHPLARLMTGALLVGTLGVAATTTAGASGQASTTTTSLPISTVTTVPLSFAVYQSEIAAINAAFTAAVQAAHTAYDAAISSRVTGAAKEAAKAQEKSAFAAAIVVYEATTDRVGVTPKERQDAMMVLNRAKKAAKAAYTIATTRSVTSADRLEAETALEMAITAAAQVRAAAITALGPVPRAA
jgi:hypothetical protein